MEIHIEECEEDCPVAHIMISTQFSHVNVYADGRVYLNFVQVTEKGGKPS